jgi:hypothetical protein
MIINSRLIFVWYKTEEIHIWDTRKGEILLTLGAPWCSGLRISGGGSEVPCLDDELIQAWSMWAWGPFDEVKLGLEGILYLDSLCTQFKSLDLLSELISPGGVGLWDFRPASYPI